MFKIAERNKIKLRFTNVDSLKKAYAFNCLQDFLDIYYEGAKVLITEEDFYDLTTAYMKRAAEDNIIHSEIFFDPQTHLDRGISFNTFFNGIYNACKDAEKKWGISSYIIMCFLRHLDEKSAFETLKLALPYKRNIIGVGLDSSEKGNPPSKFERVFKEVKNEGFKILAHAGEEGPTEYIWEAIQLLNVERIDHGNQSSKDEGLIKNIINKGLGLTMCPLSNLKLAVINDLTEHPAKKLIDKGVCVSINSDDPAYFGGYLNKNLIELTKALDLNNNDILTLIKNSINSSFLNQELKEQKKRDIDIVYKQLLIS
jgi:adenosine deaminase